VVFQEPMTSLNPVFSCGEQVAESVMKHKSISFDKASDIVISLFEKVKLPDPKRVFKSYPYQLSGGQKQRVMIAMAISCNPRLLIADEPTTALDVTVQRSILDLLKELQAEYKMGIVFITHDIGVMSYIANNVIVMYKGEVVETGTTEEILKKPNHEYTQQLINSKYKRLSAFQEVSIDEKSEPVLSLKNVSFDVPLNNSLFKNVRKSILQNITFDLYKGETLGLVGESGSGKTTIGRVIMRLIDSNSGTIVFKGKNINGFSKSEFSDFRKSVQIVFQDPYSSLNPKHTVGNALLEVLLVHNIGKTVKERVARVYELLEMVNLSADSFNRYPHQFSGGQRQRIGIARILALNPEIIIFDESIAALDVTIQAQILAILNNLKQKLNLTYIFITHDLEVVRSISNRIIVLNGGKIEEIGSSESVFSNPISEYTRNLIAASI
jgi:peptide/nickel transport system ATP-binding protein